MMFTWRFWREICCTTLIFLRIARKVMGIRCGIHTNKIQNPLVICELIQFLPTGCGSAMAVHGLAAKLSRFSLVASIGTYLCYLTQYQLQAVSPNLQKSTYNIRPTRSALCGTKSLEVSRKGPFSSLGVVYDYSLADIHRTSPYRFLPLHAATKRRVVN
jgi:hypothetical protein